MAYHFKPSRDSSRFQAWRAHQLLASRAVVAAFLIITGVTSGVSLALGLGFLTASAQLGGLILVGISLAAGLLLAFTFASTYLPYQTFNKTIASQLKEGQTTDVSVIDVASFFLIARLARFAKAGTPESLAQAAHTLFATGVARQLLKRLELDHEQVRAALEQIALPTMTWESFAFDTLTLAHQLQASQVTVRHAVGALLAQVPLKQFIRQHDLQEEDIGFVNWWRTKLAQERRAARRWWDPNRLLAFTGLGLSWTSGYTPLVDQFSRFPQGNLWDQFLLGREEQLDQLIATLARQRQSNVLVVGQPGVGRLGLVRELAHRVNTNQAHPELNGQRMAYLHIGELLARATTNASQLAIVSQVLTEMERAGNIIAVIDGLSSILGKGGEQRINLTEMLLPFFSSLTVRVVVIISSDEYHLRIKANDELIHFFEVIQVPSASQEVTLQTLAFASPVIESQARVFLPYKTLRALVRGTSGILQQIPYPERAFDVLEEALVVAQAEARPTLTSELVNQIISRKVGVPVGKLKAAERQQLLNLEDVMHKRVVNQNQAITAVTRAMIRARAGVRNEQRPIGSFLFLGPTGVGKTETAKTLAEAYFGSEDYMIRLDMSEFQGDAGVAALIGNAAQPIGRLTSLITDHPFTVLLLDEFEKAHPTVQQLFLQVLDEGHLTDARGRRVSFEHAIIIATSNAGAELIRQEAKDGVMPDDFAATLREHILGEGIFRPELLNRFDGVITFATLTPEHIRQIAQLMLKKLNKRLDAKHGVTIAITDKLVSYLMEIGYNPEFGARPMARAIQNTIEYAIARKVLEGTTQPGQEIFLTPELLKAQTVQ